MKKLLFMGAMMKELLALVREHKLYFLSPLLLALGALTLLVDYVGPTVIITFIYAGV